MNMLQHQLEDLFAQASRHIEALTKRFDANNFCLVGAGNVGRAVLAQFRKIGIEPRGFIDDTPSKHGAIIDGIPVLRERPDAATTLIVCIHNPQHDFLSTIQRFGPDTLSFLHIPWLFPELAIAHAAHPSVYRPYRDEILYIYNALSDEISRRTFMEQLAFRLTLQWNFKERSDQPYFPHDILILERETDFIDFGAFDGDTVKLFVRYAACPGKIIAVEADPRNFVKLKAYLASLGPEHVAYHAAVAGQEGELRFDATGDMAARLSSNGKLSVTAYTLEHFMNEIEGRRRPVYIKFDVEGAEAAVITESLELLRRTKPILAVSIYHDPIDIIKIPMQLHKLGYNIAMRYHGFDGADLVLYAIPK